MQRDSNIELWRCFCMFAVVLGHVMVNNKIASMGAFKWHIPGFLLITGYFGASFSLKKVVRLLGIVYGCYWLTIPIRLRWGSQESLISILSPHGGWFLPFYLALLLFSPIFNAALDNANHNKHNIYFSILVLLFFGWLPTLSTNVHINMMCIPGLQGKGVMLMLGTYFLGRFLRENNLAQRGCFGVWFAAFVFCVACMTIPAFSVLRSNDYASPFVLLAASLGFIAFLHLPRNMGRLGYVINFISPSMFGVYILHECCIKKYQHCEGNGWNAFIVTLLLFIGCIGLDLVRRGIVTGVVMSYRIIVGKMRNGRLS